jgi:predicted nucleotidyltransferase
MTSGKFVLRVGAELHQKLRDAASAKAVSLNQYCLEQLSRSFFPTTSDPTLDSVVSEVARRWGSEFVGAVLFGSAARGELNTSSDIDLLVVIDAPPTREHYDAWDRSLPKKLGVHVINPQFVRLPSTPSDAGGIWYETALEGIVLRDRKNAIHRLLAGIRELMLDGKIQRKLVHGHPYWIRKA